MKIFIVVLIVATIIGGLVGAELMDTDFSITGAVIGGVGTFAILMGLGAFFDAQERKRKEKDLPQEMRDVFDRMLGQGSTKPRPSSKASRPKPAMKPKQDAQSQFLSAAENLLSIQLVPHYEKASKAFPAIMTNKVASGYVFGFHDALLQRLGLYTPGNKQSAQELIEKSYKNIFGEQAGYTLFSMSVNSQENEQFQKGRMNGGNEVVAYLEDKTPPLGLGRIISRT